MGMCMNDIVVVGGVVSALTVITVTALKVYKYIRKWEKWVEEMSEHSLENYLSIKRLIIMSREMPISERIAAGEKYINAGGNGEVKHKYEELLLQLPKEF
jgi:hypothetical protein